MSSPSTVSRLSSTTHIASSWVGLRVHRLQAAVISSISFSYSAGRVLITSVLSVMQHILSTLIRWAITAYYGLTISGLTVWANITNQSFVVQQPGHLPHFIAPEGSMEVRAFSLHKSDNDSVAWHVALNLSQSLERHWRTASWVERSLTQPNLLNHPPPPFSIDLQSHQLAGPCLVQGQGLVGHGICVALVEEYGRFPGSPDLIAGKMVDLYEQKVVLGRFPLTFVAIPGVRETTNTDGRRVSAIHQDLEAGMQRGFQITIRSTTPISYPQFVRGPYPPHGSHLVNDEPSDSDEEPPRKERASSSDQSSYTAKDLFHPGSLSSRTTPVTYTS